MEEILYVDFIRTVIDGTKTATLYAVETSGYIRGLRQILSLVITMAKRKKKAILSMPSMKGKFGLEESLRVTGGLLAVGIGGAVGGQVGTLVGGYLGKQLASTDFGENLVWGVSLLNVVDITLEQAYGGRGLI